MNPEWFCLGIIRGHLNMTTDKVLFKNKQNHFHTKEELKGLESTVDFVGFHFQAAISLY